MLYHIVIIKQQQEQDKQQTKENNWKKHKTANTKTTQKAAKQNRNK